MKKQPRIYTKKRHIRRLRLMLARQEREGVPLRLYCPAARGYRSDEEAGENYDNNPCGVCTKFVEIEEAYACPCHYYKPEEALSRTLKALKEATQ